MDGANVVLGGDGNTGARWESAARRPAESIFHDRKVGPAAGGQNVGLDQRRRRRAGRAHLGRRALRRQHVRRIAPARRSSSSTPTGKLLQELRRRHVRLPARHPRRPRRQCLGHRRARASDGKGHQVFKFSPDGKLLMTLGKAGVAGDGPDDVQPALRRRRRAERRHLRRRRPRRRRRTCAHREVRRRTASSSRRWGKQGTGPGEFERAARARDRLAGAAVRRRPRQQPASRSSIRTASSSTSGSSSAGRAGSSSTATTSLYVADSESNTTAQSRVEARHPRRQRQATARSPRSFPIPWTTRTLQPPVAPKAWPPMPTGTSSAPRSGRR